MPSFLEALREGYSRDTLRAETPESIAEIAADPVTQDWWRLCGPCQDPLESRADDEWWAMMEEVFHTD